MVFAMAVHPFHTNRSPRNRNVELAMILFGVFTMAAHTFHAKTLTQKFIAW